VTTAATFSSSFSSSSLTSVLFFFFFFFFLFVVYVMSLTRTNYKAAFKALQCIPLIIFFQFLQSFLLLLLLSMFSEEVIVMDYGSFLIARFFFV